MRWFGRRDRAKRVTRAADPGTPVICCATCGTPLGADREDEPTGDAGQPICGECDRQRDFDALDMADGDLDGTIGS